MSKKGIWAAGSAAGSLLIVAFALFFAESLVVGASCHTKSGPNAGWDTTHTEQDCQTVVEEQTVHWTCPKEIARVPAFTECQDDPTNDRCCESEKKKAKCIRVNCGNQVGACPEQGEVPAPADWPYEYLTFKAFHNCTQDPNDPTKWIPAPECSN